MSINGSFEKAVILAKAGHLGRLAEARIQNFKAVLDFPGKPGNDKNSLYNLRDIGKWERPQA